MDKLSDHKKYKIKDSDYSIEHYAAAGEDYYNFLKNDVTIFGLLLQSETKKYKTFRSWVGNNRQLIKIIPQELIPVE